MQTAFVDDTDLELGQRLRKAREAKGIEPKAAATRMRIAYPTLMNHEQGHRGARRRIMDYARLYGVNYVWLASGGGPMKGPDALVADIQALDPRDRGAVEALVTSLKGHKAR